MAQLSHSTVNLHFQSLTLKGVISQMFFEVSFSTGSDSCCYLKLYFPFLNSHEKSIYGPSAASGYLVMTCFLQQ